MMQLRIEYPCVPGVVIFGIEQLCCAASEATTKMVVRRQADSKRVP